MDGLSFWGSFSLYSHECLRVQCVSVWVGSVERVVVTLKYYYIPSHPKPTSQPSTPPSPPFQTIINEVSKIPCQRSLPPSCEFFIKTVPCPCRAMTKLSKEKKVRKKSSEPRFLLFRLAPARSAPIRSQYFDAFGIPIGKCLLIRYCTYAEKNNVVFCFFPTP